MGNDPIFVGPYGGTGGNHWDDGSYTGVKIIWLTYGGCIDSIEIVYRKNDNDVTSQKHGGTGGNKNVKVELQPNEYLTGVSGYVGKYVAGGEDVIRSLIFKTNKGKFGPYGEEKGKEFSFEMEGGKIVGFRGKAGSYLDNIGFYITKS